MRPTDRAGRVSRFSVTRRRGIGVSSSAFSTLQRHPLWKTPRHARRLVRGTAARSVFPGFHHHVRADGGLGEGPRRRDQADLARIVANAAASHSSSPTPAPPASSSEGRQDARRVRPRDRATGGFGADYQPDCAGEAPARAARLVDHPTTNGARWRSSRDWIKMAVDVAAGTSPMSVQVRRDRLARRAPASPMPRSSSSPPRRCVAWAASACSTPTASASRRAPSPRLRLAR